VQEIRTPKATGHAHDGEHDKLSPRETEIILLLAKGASNKEMARTLNVAESTVKIHVQNILKKLNLTSRVQAAVYAVEHGMAQKEET
jgi:two-component system nitrate/nitrite response regulator NarL